MGGNVVSGRKNASASVLAVNCKFKQYKPEVESRIRRQQVKPDKKLGQLRALFCDYYKNARKILYRDSPEFEKLMGAISWPGISSRDVEKFSSIMGEFESGRLSRATLGKFISGMIRSSNDTEFTVHTKHLTELPDELALRKPEQTLVVNGDAGYYVGRGMTGGRVIIEGNLDDYAGSEMKGGSIMVKGNAGHCIGEGMEGGEIHTDGEIGEIGNVKHGKIFHKGKLIVDK